MITRRAICVFVPFFGQTHVWFAPLVLECFFPFLAQMLFQNHGVARVALVHRIRKVSHKWNEADDEVDDNVGYHFSVKGAGQTSINIAARLHNHQGEQGIDYISNAVAR